MKESVEECTYLIREGTVAKNLNELVKGASIYNSRRLCLCTDDKHIDDLLRNGVH